jgi:hypothetical protein
MRRCSRNSRALMLSCWSVSPPLTSRRQKAEAKTLPAASGPDFKRLSINTNAMSMRRPSSPCDPTAVLASAHALRCSHSRSARATGYQAPSETRPSFWLELNSAIMMDARSPSAVGKVRSRCWSPLRSPCIGAEWWSIIAPGRTDITEYTWTGTLTVSAETITVAVNVGA